MVYLARYMLPILAGVGSERAVSRRVLDRHRGGRRQVEQLPASRRGLVKVGDVGSVRTAAMEI